MSVFEELDGYIQEGAPLNKETSLHLPSDKYGAPLHYMAFHLSLTVGLRSVQVRFKKRVVASGFSKKRIHSINLKRRLLQIPASIMYTGIMSDAQEGPEAHGDCPEA